MNAGTFIEAWHDVQIGDNVLMAPFASIIDDDRHEIEPGAALYKGPTSWEITYGWVAMLPSCPG